MWCVLASTEKEVPTGSGAAPSISTGSSGSGSSYGTTSRSDGGEMTFRGHKIPVAFSVLVWCLVWEVVGRLGLISLIPPFTEVLGAMPEVMGSASFAEAAMITFQAYGIGMALSLTIGIGVGILMGRVRAIGELMGMWVNIFERSPLTAVVPALIALLGFGLSTMIVTVFVFSVWVIALDTQVRLEARPLSEDPVFRRTPRVASGDPPRPDPWPEGRNHRPAADRGGGNGVPLRTLLAKLPDGRVLGAADRGVRICLPRLGGSCLLRTQGVILCDRPLRGRASYDLRRAAAAYHHPARSRDGRELPGLSGVLRRPQLRRARRGDGSRPEPGATVLLRQAGQLRGTERRDPAVPVGNGGSAPRDRARGGAGGGWGGPHRLGRPV